MRATVVVDNKEGCGLAGEWGLSIYIEYKDKNILLDAGASNLFLSNMTALGLDITKVDFGVLSHAHFDHGNGIPTFFKANDKAPFYIQKSCGEDCYCDEDFEKEYIGLPKGLLEEYKGRIKRVEGCTKISEGIYLLGHTTEGLSEVGRREKMYILRGEEKITDDFSHEQSLIFETEKGLVVFNSCSHGGAGLIAAEVQRAFPGKAIAGLIGGFHLYNKSEEELSAFAKTLKDLQIPYICTGHCTGDKAFAFLKEVLGDTLHGLQVGLVMNFD